MMQSASRRITLRQTTNLIKAVAFELLTCTRIPDAIAHISAPRILGMPSPRYRQPVALTNERERLSVT
jgi:hypothetical protein